MKKNWDLTTVRGRGEFHKYVCFQIRKSKGVQKANDHDRKYKEITNAEGIESATNFEIGISMRYLNKSDVVIRGLGGEKYSLLIRNS